MFSIIYIALLFLGSTLPEFHEERRCYLYLLMGNEAQKLLDDLLVVTMGRNLISYVLTKRDGVPLRTMAPHSACLGIEIASITDCFPFFHFQVMPITYPKLRLLEYILKKS